MQRCYASHGNHLHILTSLAQHGNIVGCRELDACNRACCIYMFGAGAVVTLLDAVIYTEKANVLTTSKGWPLSIAGHGVLEFL